MTLSRREFLHLTGITAASMSLFGIALPQPDAHAAPEVIRGRTLTSTTLRTPSGEQPLWADTILNIREHSAAYYTTDAGVVPREHIQPMTPYNPKAGTPHTVPCYAEVAAPAATIREYADARAALTARVGHGGVMQITEHIENRGGVWVALTSADGARVGWSQAVRWRALPDRTPAHTRQHVTIDHIDGTFTAYDDGHPVFKTQTALPAALHTGDYTLRHRAVGAQTHGNLYGVPYCFTLNNTIPLHGAYWHNRFGVRHAARAVELNVLAAKWLYYWAGDNVPMQVV